MTDLSLPEAVRDADPEDIEFQFHLLEEGEGQ